MAYFNRVEVGLKNISTDATIPNDPTAKLMYYLNCMCTVLQLDDDADINRLRRYNNYRWLDRSDTDLLVSLCILLKPDVLLNKCIFQDDRLCGARANAFYELETVRNNLLVAGSVMIGGRQRRVNKIMSFKMSWLHNHWTQPMQTMIARQRQQRQAIMQRDTQSSSCTIL